MNFGRSAKFAVALLLVSSSIARGDDACPPPPTVEVDLGGPVRLRTPSAVITEGGSSLRLPAGYYLAEPLWTSWELKLRRLQDAETRLTAENDSLRKSAAGWSPGWRTLATALLVGMVAGGYGYHKLHD